MNLLSTQQRLQLCRLLEEGLPLVSQPYRLLAQQIGAEEAAVLAQVQRWQAEGLFRRVGLVLRHRALGFAAYAMLVLDVPDAEVDAVGERLGRIEGITLCYRRPRRLPQWPYNLFCMVHGQQREQVSAWIAALLATQGLAGLPHQLLFSSRAFKQCGGRYAAAQEVAHG